MSQNQADRIAENCKRGFRVKSNGDKVYLSEHMVRQGLLDVRAARAKQFGAMSYDSAQGPAMRTQNGYVSRTVKA